MAQLDSELETFNRWLPSALMSCPGKWALIKGDVVIGVFASEGDALEEGFRLYATGLFMVRQVTEPQPPHRVSFEVSVPSPRAGVYAEIDAERRRQDAEFGGPSRDNQHGPETWVSLAARQLGLAASQDSTTAGGRHPDPAHFRRKMLTLAAVAVAAIEACDRAAPALAKHAGPTAEQMESWKGY